MSNMMMLPMIMSYSCQVTVVFSWFTSLTCSGLSFICLICALISLLRHYIQHLRVLALQDLPVYPKLLTSQQKQLETTMRFADVATPLNYRIDWSNKLSLSHLILFGSNTCLAFLLMLMVMCMNVYVLLAIIFGECVGYYLFATHDIIHLLHSESHH